jgi:3-deoxy-D-manno-octulosonic-acid transferase
MYALYTAILTVGLILTFPYYLIRFRKYLPTIGERLGFLTAPRGRNAIWVHAVSVGEVKAIDGLITGLRRRFPKRPLVLSTTTPTGRALALQRTDVDLVIYFPLDLPGPVRRSLKRIQPGMVIVAETEIWPNFLRQCTGSDIPVYMINGRISDKSYGRYQLAARWLPAVLGHYQLLGMQSETDATRIRALGAVPDKVVVFGNVKYDTPTDVPELDHTLGMTLAESGPWLVAASTAAEEEPYVLDAYQQVRSAHPNLKLLIAPRLPDRFEEVDRLIRGRNFRLVRRSKLRAIPAPGTYDVLLLDTIGELTSVFSSATVVFMGGTLVARGGHNVLEPARFEKPIVFGPHMENFRDMAATFLKAGAAIEVQSSDELGHELDRILSTPSIAADLGSRARGVVEANSGATQRVLEAIFPGVQTPDVKSIEIGAME